MCKKRIKSFFLYSTLLLLFSSWNNDNTLKLSTFDSAVENFAKDETLKSASWGLSVFSVDSQTEIYSKNSNLTLIPASTLKAVTTSTALILLESDYKYETRLMHEGDIDINGTLNGNLHIIGAGDPSLGSNKMNDSLKLENVFEHFLISIHASGIRKINGSIIADTRIFDSQIIPPKWLWEDLGNYFGAGTSGLSANENEYSIFFKAADYEGEPATVLHTKPEIPGMVLHNYATTAEAGSGDNIYIYGVPYSNERWLRGTIPLGVDKFEVRGSMPDPALYFVNAFYDFLKNNNIEISGIPKVIHQHPHKTNIINIKLKHVASWYSPQLKEIAHRTNLHSVNSYAESLIKTIASVYTGEGTTENGIEKMMNFWQSKGVNIIGVNLYDGSGLSPNNRITTNALAHMMALSKQESIFEDFKNGLPLAGQTGALKSGFKNTASENILSAKSGYLNNVLAFTGFTITKRNTLVSFAIIVNNYEGSSSAMRKKIFRLMNSITLSDL